MSGWRGLVGSVLFLALLATAGPLAGAAAQGRSSLQDVLARAGAYVVEYGEALATIVADEEYVQELVAADGRVLERRVLDAEIVFVRLADSREWQAFRNVLRVDGEDIAGAARRLERLFSAAPSSVVDQARRMATEGARYNLGPLLRTFNAPTMPLQFLHPSHQDRFRFTREGEETMEGEDVWVVRFRDRGGATLIRDTAGRAVPVDGRFRIAPGDGRVVGASFVATGFLPDERGGRRSRAELDVRWHADERLALWVPAEMHERYAGPWDDGGVPYDIVGRARYANYRRFEVDARILDVTR